MSVLDVREGSSKFVDSSLLLGIAARGGGHIVHRRVRIQSFLWKFFLQNIWCVLVQLWRQIWLPDEREHAVCRGGGQRLVLRFKSGLRNIFLPQLLTSIGLQVTVEVHLSAPLVTVRLQSWPGSLLGARAVAGTTTFCKPSNSNLDLLLLSAL